MHKFMPPHLTERVWRAQVGLTPLPPAVRGGGGRDLSGNVFRKVCPIPDMADLLAQEAKGKNLKLVLAMSAGAHDPSANHALSSAWRTREPAAPSSP